MHPREDDLRPGRADVDADGGQRDIVLLPQGIVFKRAVIVEVMIMVMIGVVGMHMSKVPAVEVIGQGMRGFGFFLFGHPVRRVYIPRARPGVNTIRRNPNVPPGNTDTAAIARGQSLGKSPSLIDSIGWRTDAVGRMR
jgi:hypothetical protein